MKNLELLIMFLPIVFMVHEYEEIIMFKGWLAKNKVKLAHQFPKIHGFLEQYQLFEFSMSTFAVGTLCNFLLISVITFVSIWFDNYQWWWVALVGHTVHLIIHFIQWIVYREYVPVIVTTILTLPYCIYAGIKYIEWSTLSFENLLLLSIQGVILMLLSFPLTWFLMLRFHRRKNNLHRK